MGILRNFHLLALLTLATPLLATDYYVRKDGSDANPGTADTSGGAKLTVQAGVDLLSAGDTLYIRAGRYDESVSTAASGTALSVITIDGGDCDATIKQFIFSGHDYVTVQGVRFAGQGNYPVYYVDQDGSDEFTGIVYFGRDADNCIMDNCIVDGTTSRFVDGIEFQAPSGMPWGSSITAASNCVIRNTVIRNITEAPMLTLYGDDNIIEDCHFKDGVMVDFLRLFGRRNIIRDNFFENNFQSVASAGYHPDFVQTFGPNGEGSLDHVIERNVVKNIVAGQLCQLTDAGIGQDIIGNWVFRNNLFIQVTTEPDISASCSIQDVKFYNNLFYDCVATGNPLSAGTREFAHVTCSPQNPGASNTWTATSHQLSDGWIIRLSTTGTLPGGFSTNTDYYVVNSAANTIEISATSGGAAIQPTTAGSGTHTIQIQSKAHGFEVKNNIFLDCGDERLTVGWYGIASGEGLQNVAADYNYVAKDGFGGIDSDGTIAVGDAGDNWSDFGNWYEPNGMTGDGADPGFLNWESLDFRLVAGSDLLGQGVTGLVTDDYNEAVRSNPPSIGPYEQFGGNFYYVATTGDNGNLGTAASPWATIAYAESQLVAGDVVLVQPGTYAESVEINVGGTDEKNRTRFIADGGTVTTKAFRIQDTYIEINGFTLQGCQFESTWETCMIRVEADSDYLLVQDCTFGPGIYYIPSDETVVFDAGDDTVYDPNADFVTAGFEVGGSVRFGACSLTEQPSGNHPYHFSNYVDEAGQAIHVIAAVTANEITVASTPGLTAETLKPSGAWAPIYAAHDKHGISGIDMQLSGGTGPEHCRITGSTFTNMFGRGIELQGRHNEVDNCTWTDTNSWWSLSPNGSHHYIHHNLFKDAINTVLRFTTDETADITHGTGAFDFDVGYIHTASGGNGLQMYRNWFQNIEQPLTQIGEQAGDAVLDFYYNVVVGVAKPASNGRNFSIIRNNTFYKAGYRHPFDVPITMGGNSPDLAEDFINSYNMFVDVGAHDQPQFEFYTVVDTTGASSNDYNFAAGHEFTGYAVPSDFVGDETHGIEGGNPLFINPADPLGPDGLPFTADDGLRPLATSPAILGSGLTDPYGDFWVGALDVWEIIEDQDGVSDTFTVDNPSVTATLNATGHPFEDGFRIKLSTTNTIPTGLGTKSVDIYWVVNSTANTFELASSEGGAGIVPTSAGTGTHTATSLYNEPVAQFEMTTLTGGLSWKENVEDYDTAWLALKPFERTNEMRPWTTAPLLGDSGVQATFSAAATLGGLDEDTATGVSTYAWTTSDGGSQSGASTTFSHTFNSPGTITVTLTVTNSEGGTDAITRTYGVDGSAPAHYRRSPSRAARTGALPFLP